ncbi:MAG: formyltransferase family protein [Thermodesulfobacteriota bacterium]|nr:formyltransferase family protein [Thermodesulfobacteriota bacterium]
MTRGRRAEEMVGHKKNVVVIGSGKPAVDCVKAIQKYNSNEHDIFCNLAMVITDATNMSFGARSDIYYEKSNIPHILSNDINSDEIIIKLSEIRIDYIFSVNNNQIIKKRLLEVPGYGIINFHNAPLPKYAGLNACTWAIVNGEKEHGITWHFVDEGVDSGDIIAQKVFPLEEETTAIQLIMRCIQEGAVLFESILPGILKGDISRTKQDSAKRLFYRQDMIPNSGNVDFGWDFDTFNNFVRGLDFNPFPNPLAHPKAEYHGRVFYIDKIKLVEKTSRNEPGRIVKAGPDGVHVAVDGAIVSLEAVRDGDKKSIKIPRFVTEYQIQEGRGFGVAQ